MIKHGSVIRPTVCLESMDIQTAFDVARPKHIARIMEKHNVHGWIIAALSREMTGLQGQVTFECAESKFSFRLMRSPRERRGDAGGIQLRKQEDVIQTEVRKFVANKNSPLGDEGPFD